MAGGGEEEDDGSCILQGYHPEGGVVAEMLCHDSSQETTDAEPQVPADEDAAVGCASLVVPCHIHEHIEEGWV